MVKIKNPDENLLNGNHIISIDPNPKSSSNDVDSKRFVVSIFGWEPECENNFYSIYQSEHSSAS